MNNTERQEGLVYPEVDYHAQPTREPEIGELVLLWHEIEISRDDKGYWFDIHSIERIYGDSTVVKQLILLLHDETGPFQTAKEAIDAATKWIKERGK